MSSNSQSQNIQVTIELGHQASFKKKPSPEGYTHDWSVFVRGPEGSKIQHYVEKVVFQLHESFAKPKRVVKEPPYQVSESGYAGFNFPIIIYFRNKEIPKKISFDYDLFLNAENCPPINNVRYEKLTFKNPNEEFRQKLLKAGGQPMGNPALMETAGTPSSSSSKSDSGKKLPKTSTSTTSSKDGSSSNSKDKTPKHKSSLISSSSSKPSTPQSTPVASKEIKSVTHTTTISVSKDHKSRGKEAQKRPSTSSPPDGEMSGKKIKRSSSISSDLGKEKHSHKSDKDKKKSSKDSSKSKSKHSSKSDKHEKKKDKHKHSSSNSDKKTKNTSSSETKTSSNSQSSKKSSDSIPFPSDIPMKTALLSPLKDSSDDDEDDKTVKKDSDSVSSLSSDLSSSSSSISLSPLPEAERKKSNSKYDALMAELGDSDSSDDDFNVKIPVIPPSPPPSLPPPLLPKSTPETKPVAVIESKQTKKSKSSSSQSKKSSSKSEKSKSKESKKKDSSKSSKESKTSNSKESPEVIQNGVAKEDNKSEVVAENGETLASLWELHDRIMASRDSDMLEEVVGLIQETGLFKVTDTSFDFDLCSIDKETVQKIFKCVSSVS